MARAGDPRRAASGRAAPTGQLGDILTAIPEQFWSSLPYIVTIIVLGSGLYLWLARRRSSIEVEIEELERAEARLAAE